MADGMYVGMAAMTAREHELEAIADNMANAETPGYKAEMYAFETFFPDDADGNMASVAAVNAGLDHRTGVIRQTGRPLDVLPSDENFFAVEMKNGNVGYTRNAQMAIAPDGTLTIAGNPVLNDGGSPVITPLNLPVRISTDGTVWSGDNQLDRLGTHTLPGELVRLSPSIVVPKDGITERANGRVRVGEVELSNVSALEASIDMIQTQRNFDHAVQAVQTYRKIDDRAIQVGKV